MTIGDRVSWDASGRTGVLEAIDADGTHRIRLDDGSGATWRKQPPRFDVTDADPDPANAFDDRYESIEDAWPTSRRVADPLRDPYV